MTRTPDLAIECFRNAKKSTVLPVSIKTRLGWSQPNEYQEWLPVLLAEHPAALTIHLRTKKEMSKVPAHYELIPEIIELRNQISPKTKLIINGDIRDKAHALELHSKHPEVDGFMIGRGVFTNPYCFTDHQPTHEELIELLKLHLGLYEKQSQKYYIPYETLKHFFKIYVNNFPGAKELRTKLMETHSAKEARDIINS